MDELLADYRHSREQLASVQWELGAVTAAASDPDGLLTATVGARGALTGLAISDEAYQRYRPSELAGQIVRATGSATLRALAAAAVVLAPVLPAGTDQRAVLLGTADLEAVDIAPPKLATEEDSERSEDSEDSYENRNWGVR